MVTAAKEQQTIIDNTAALRHDVRGFLASAQQWNHTAIGESEQQGQSLSANMLVASQLEAIEELLNAHLLKCSDIATRYDTVINSVKRAAVMCQSVAIQRGVTISITAIGNQVPSRINFAEMLSLFSNAILNAVQNADEVVNIEINDQGPQWFVNITNDGKTMPVAYRNFLLGGPVPKNYERMGLQIIRAVVHNNKMGLAVTRRKNSTSLKIISTPLAIVK